MTENEIIETHIAENIHRIEVIEWFIRSNSSADKEKCEKNKKVLTSVNGLLQEIQQYRAIGTIEEFKALKEKSVAKKPTPIDYEKYMDVVTNAKFLRGACWCPNCKHTVLSGVYCGNCGQKLDWSE